jgi:hypothetical protein
VGQSGRPCPCGRLARNGGYCRTCTIHNGLPDGPTVAKIGVFPNGNEVPLHFRSGRRRSWWTKSRSGPASDFRADLRHRHAEGRVNWLGRLVARASRPCSLVPGRSAPLEATGGSSRGVASGLPLVRSGSAGPGAGAASSTRMRPVTAAPAPCGTTYRPNLDCPLWTCIAISVSQLFVSYPSTMVVHMSLSSRLCG